MKVRKLRASVGAAIVTILFAAVALGGILQPVLSSPSGFGTSAFPFPCVTGALAVHVHPWLRIVVGRSEVPIPALIGIHEPPAGQAGFSCDEPLHTHDDSGIIHLEAGNSAPYTLGDFFRIWRATYPTADVGGKLLPVSYGSNELFGIHGRPLLYVDGQPSFAGPNLVLNRLDYCTASDVQLPCAPTAVTNPYPSSYASRYGTGHAIVLILSQPGA